MEGGGGGGHSREQKEAFSRRDETVRTKHGVCAQTDRADGYITVRGSLHCAPRFVRCLGTYIRDGDTDLEI